jgi:glycosyltransferase involved in cell wall biosynthesis
VRILIAHSSHRVAGGDDTYVRAQVDLLAREHDVELLLDSNADLASSVTTAARMLYSPQRRREVDSILDRFRPDIVHVHNVYPSLGPAVHLATKRRRIPLVMTVHNLRMRCPNGLMFTEGAPCRRCERGAYFNAALHGCFPTKEQSLAYASVLWVHRFPLALDRSVDAFLVPSAFLHRRLRAWGFPEDRIRTVPHFVVPPSVIQPSRPAADRYGIYVGRLSMEKGVDVLLRALRRMGDPRFLVVGDGPGAAHLRSLARDLDLSRTEFLGHRPRDEVPALLSGARVAAVPSLVEEAFGLSALEAMAVGCPIVVSDRGALPELVRDGAGVVSAAGDVDRLAASLAALMHDDDARRLASDRAIRTASTFTPERHAAVLLAAYQDVLDRSRAGSST